LNGQNRIYIHGEKEFEQVDRNMVSGIPLMPEVVHSLKEAGEKTGVPFDLQQVN